jgi:hypothetical protein
MGGEKDEGFSAGVGLDSGVGLAGKAVTGEVGCEIVVEQLLLGVTDIGGEEEVMGVCL